MMVIRRGDDDNDDDEEDDEGLKESAIFQQQDLFEPVFWEVPLPPRENNILITRFSTNLVLLYLRTILALIGPHASCSCSTQRMSLIPA